VRELRSSSPVLAATGPVRKDHQLYNSSTNISSISQPQSLREHNKRFSASAVALHSNHMFTNSRGNLVKP